MAKTAQSHDRNLREDIIAQSLAIIETDGLERLSMREVARRLGVSHQAPYKHFASRDHILAEIVGRAFEAFADYLDAGARTGTAHQDMEKMGQAYLGYAIRHPLNYRLMFGTPLPGSVEHPEMMAKARHAFTLLRDNVALLHAQGGRSVSDREIALDALYVWSTLHGLASILKGDTIHSLDLPADTLAAAPAGVLARIGGGFSPQSA